MARRGSGNPWVNAVHQGLWPSTALALFIATCVPGTTTVSPPPAESSPRAAETPVESPAATPSASTIRGVLIARPSNTVDPAASPYAVILVDVEGRVESATATSPSEPWPLPLVSVSDRHVYFIDGDKTVVSFDGRERRTVARVPGGPRDRAVFAVSPDESRIAVTVVHYEPPAAHCVVGCLPTVSFRIYVEDLGTGANHVDILGPTPANELRVSIPIGWRDGRLLVALAYAAGQDLVDFNPYMAVEYRIVDASTARRLTAIGADCFQLLGPVVGAGTGCARRDGSVLALDWDGRRTELLTPASRYIGTGALTPSGDRVAIGTYAIGPHREEPIIIAGGGSRTQLPHNGRPLGWIGSTHLAFADQDERVFITDIGTGRVQPVSLQGHRIATRPPFFATLPATRP